MGIQIKKWLEVRADEVIIGKKCLCMGLNFIWELRN